MPGIHAMPLRRARLAAVVSMFMLAGTGLLRAGTIRVGVTAGPPAYNHPFPCGYPRSSYPSQDGYDPYDTNCGNGQMGGDQQSMAVATNYGALNLYLNFINLFQFLLSIFGNRR